MDINVLLWFQGLRTPLLNTLSYGVTLFAEEAVLLVLLCAMYWCFAKREALFVIFSFFAGLLVNNALKISFCVLRPWLRDARVIPYEKAIASATGYSFPSGHTACAVAVYGSFSLLLWKKKRWAACLLLLLTALIGVSRMYVGVHTPQDVLVSLVVGAALLFVVRAGMRGLDKHPERDTWVLAGGLLVALALMLFSHFKPYPADTDRALLQDAYKTAGALAGMAIAWFLERRFVRFDPRAVWWLQAVKIIVGVLGILAVRALLKPVCIALVGEDFGGALRYFLLVLWAIWLWPLLFSKGQRLVEKR